jgi:hypothetical protein
MMVSAMHLRPHWIERRRSPGAALLALIVLMTAAAASGDTLTGTVRDAAGAPVAGAMVSAVQPKLRRATTVYSDERGAFSIPGLEAGLYDVRVRRIGYQDLLQSGVDIGNAPASLDVRVEAETDPQALAWQLPASRWLPLLLAKLSSDAHREEFMRQCAFCHQQGSWATRVPRSRADWDKIFTLMGRMGGVISPGLRAELPDAFNSAYADESYLHALTPVTYHAPAGAAATALITEWDLGEPASTQHDLTVHPDGTIFSVDTNQDKLYRLDPRTSQRWAYDIPRGDSPLGGVFGGTGMLLAPNSNAHVAPHSLQVAPDGSIWVTLCLGNKLGRFDPKTEQWQIIEQNEGLYPHTLRFDRQGRIWYTLAISNHVGMFDPPSGERRTRACRRIGLGAGALRLTPYFLPSRVRVAGSAGERRASTTGPLWHRHRARRRRVVQPAQRTPHRPHRSGAGDDRDDLDAVLRAAPHALRFQRQSLDRRLQRRRRRALRPGRQALRYLEAAHRGRRDALRAQRRPPHRHGVDLRHQLRQPGASSRSASISPSNAADARHLHARDRFRQRRRRVNSNPTSPPGRSRRRTQASVSNRDRSSQRHRDAEKKRADEFRSGPHLQSLCLRGETTSLSLSALRVLVSPTNQAPSRCLCDLGADPRARGCRWNHRSDRHRGSARRAIRARWRSGFRN